MVSLSPNTQTSIVSNLFNNDPYYQFYTDGMNNDATTASITVTFDQTSSISRVMLKGHNLKSFTIFYNGSTANTFSLLKSSTSTSDWSSNSLTSTYLQFSTIQASSITIDMKSTQEANLEKIISQLYIGDLIYTTTRVPSAKDYKPKFKSKQIVHKLSDGGTRINHVKNKWEMNIKYSFITEAERDSLYGVWDMLEPFHFVPFQPLTSTADWDGIAFESVWEGDFEFYEYSDNAAVSGFTGSIKLRETPN